MAERFTKFYSFPANLYEDLAPVVLVAGNLLKDNQLHRVLAQLKIKNIDKRTIDKITLQFSLLDADGNVLEDQYRHTVEGLQLVENDFYGAKNPIDLPNRNTTACKLEVVKVVFADGSVWSSSGTWESLGADRDVDALKAERNRRLDEEKQRKAAADKAADDAKAKKSKRTAVIIGSIVVVLIIATVLISSIVKWNQKVEAYNSALALFDAGLYDEAVSVFSALGDYKDSREKTAEAKYSMALVALADGQDEVAYQRFQELGDYKDSALYTSRFQYLLVKYVADYGATTVYAYDSYGRLIEEKLSGVADKQYTYYADGTYSVYSSYSQGPYTLFYNNVGDITRRVNSVADITYEWEYSEDGLTKTSTTIENGEVQAVDTYYLDEHHNVIDETVFGQRREHQYTYDEAGRILLYETYIYGEKSGFVEYVYDEYGSVIKQTNKMGSTEFECTYAHVYCPDAS